MEASTQVALNGLLWIALAPAASVVAVGLLATRLPDRLRPAVAGAALLLGLLVAWLGLAGLPKPAADAQAWVPLGALAAGALALAAERLLPARLRTPAVALVGLAALSFFGFKLLAPLAGVWIEGQTLALVSQKEWAVDALALAFLSWLGVTHAARRVAAPVVLGPLALALVGVALSAALTGSASMAERVGAAATATATAGFLGWRFPKAAPGVAAGAVAVSVALFASYAHFYVETPRPGLSLIVLAPLGVLAALNIQRTLLAVVVALAATAVPVGAGVWLAWEADAAKQAAAGADAGDDSGYY